MNNDVPSSCCKKRQARFDVLCGAVNNTIYDTVNEAIDEIYLVDKCSEKTDLIMIFL